MQRSGLTFSLEFDPPPLEALAKARAGEVAILTSDQEDRVRAIVRLGRALGRRSRRHAVPCHATLLT